MRESAGGNIRIEQTRVVHHTCDQWSVSCNTKGYSIATKAEGDHWVGEIRRMDGKAITIDGTTLHTFTTMKASSSDDAVKLASQAIDSGKLGPVEIA